MENSLQKAQTLFDLEQYGSAVNMCIELIKNNTDNKKDTFFLAAKSFLFTMRTPTNESQNETFLNTFRNACAEAKSTEEVLELERDMTAAIYEWKAKSIKAKLADIEKCPTYEQWNEYIHFPLGYTKLTICVSIYARNCQAVNSYCEVNGIEKRELNDKLEMDFGDRFKTSEVITDEEIKILEYETARKIFENIQAKLSANNDGNADYVRQTAKVIITELGVVGCIVDSSLNSNEITPNAHCERLLLKANLISFSLSALIYPNGSPLSLYIDTGDRNSYIENLKEIYSKIQELDPSFEVPELPDVEPVGQPQANNSSSGGCYVATAVYGSYDCPQVWTLRRFRDYTLAETWYGRGFIRTYYAISPTLVKWFGHTAWFKNMWKPKLDRLVKKLNSEGVEDTAYNDRVW